MNQFSVFLGVFTYEFRMQLRRRSIWITMLLIILLILLLLSRTAGVDHILNSLKQHPIQDIVVYWTDIVNAILPIAVGVLLADRLPRDRKTKVDELFTSMPGALSIRLLGKYLGSMVATLVPVLIFYLLGMGVILYATQNPLALLIALEAFAAIVLPGIFFISAFSIACPAIMWVPLYQFLFVGYWFWGNLLSPGSGIPTLNNTLLTPVGEYQSLGFFNVNIFQLNKATVLQGVESIVLLLGLAAFAMFVLWGYLRLVQARQ
jgi:ABC-2 type transport system permease protein